MKMQEIIAEENDSLIDNIDAELDKLLAESMDKAAKKVKSAKDTLHITNARKKLEVIAANMSEGTEWKLIKTVECYHIQLCDNCKSVNKQYSGTYQIQQHRQFRDRRKLIKVPEQFNSINELHTVVTHENIKHCHDCRGSKGIDITDDNEFSSLFKGLI